VLALLLVVGAVAVVAVAVLLLVLPASCMVASVCQFQVSHYAETY
jgi:hypothetical protein